MNTREVARPRGNAEIEGSRVRRRLHRCIITELTPPASDLLESRAAGRFTCERILKRRHIRRAIIVGIRPSTHFVYDRQLFFSD